MHDFRSSPSVLLARDSISVLEVFSEEIGGGAIGLNPAFLGEEAVNFIGEDEFLEFDTLFAQSFDQRNGLVEGDIAIVVAVDE